ADTDSDAFDRYLRSALGVMDRGANRFSESHLIAYATFGPSRRMRKPVGEIANLVAVKGADDTAGARAAGIEADSELKFRRHLLPHRDAIVQAEVEGCRVGKTPLDFGIVAKEVLIAQAVVAIAQEQGDNAAVVRLGDLQIVRIGNVDFRYFGGEVAQFA